MDRHSSPNLNYWYTWKETFLCSQAIAQKGFDERHAYIGGMFGWETYLDQKPNQDI